MRLGSFCSLLSVAHPALSETGKPLGLQEVMAIALKENLTIQTARNVCKKESFSHKKENISRWLPAAKLQLLKSEQWADPNRSNSDYWYIAMHPTFTLEAKLDLFENAFQIKKFHQQKLLRKLRQTEKIRDELEEVIDCYHALAAAQKKLTRATIFIALANAKLQLAEKQKNIGKITKVTYLEIKLALEEAKLSLLEKQEAVKKACRTLNIKLGRSPNEAVVVQSFISPEPLWDMTAILKKHRTDLRTTIRKKEIMSVKTELSKDKASLFSCVQLNVTFTTDKKIFDKKNKMFGPTQPEQMTCTFGINLDLEQLLLLPAKLRATRLALNHATFALVQQKLQAKEVLASAQASYCHTVAAYRIEAEKLKISKQKLQEVKENYRLNKKTLIDLQEEETKVYEIEMKVIEQGYKVKKAEFALYKLTGMLDR
ncbi:hypothetical protein DK880_00963 [Candidatus Cardinium hertigii]|uniref:TolC family protein n=2 Tax=Candidatus Cardinium hertigii TaxID=247481 RepID=A0A2Z3LJP3_9BACT|nr:hypothetical protein DK880_00963 [Candidatus Cardinium hertigii]